MVHSIPSKHLDWVELAMKLWEECAFVTAVFDIILDYWFLFHKILLEGQNIANTTRVLQRRFSSFSFIKILSCKTLSRVIKGCDFDLEFKHIKQCR